VSEHFKTLCAAFDDACPSLKVFPWDPKRAAKLYATASHGERLILSFLLGVWNPGTDWTEECKSFKRFDIFEAANCLDRELLAIMSAWLCNPRFP